MKSIDKFLEPAKFGTTAEFTVNSQSTAQTGGLDKVAEQLKEAGQHKDGKSARDFVVSGDRTYRDAAKTLGASVTASDLAIEGESRHGPTHGPNGELGGTPVVTEEKTMEERKKFLEALIPMMVAK